jgi:uncharacterized protein (TIGR00251 family)
MSWLRQDGADWLLAVRVQPRASRDEVTGVQGERLRLRLTAPPVEGAANRHLERYLAGLFGVAPSRVTVIRGESSREKQVRVRGPVALPAALAQHR